MYFTECSVPISLALWNPILEWRATLNPASICCSWDYWRTKCLIDNGNKPKHFQKLFTQRLFQTGYSRFYDTSRSQDFSLGWKSIQCSKKNSRKTWQLNEFLPFPLERGTIRSILKVLYYSGKIKDRQAYIAVLVLRSSTSLVFSLSFSSTFFFFKTDRSLVQLILGVLHDFTLFFVYRPIHSVSSSFARHHTKKFSGRWMLIAAWTSGAARRWLKQGKSQSCKKYWKQTKGLSRTCSVFFLLFQRYSRLLRAWGEPNKSWPSNA